MNSKHPYKLLVALLAALSLFAAACGGSSDSAGDSASSDGADSGDSAAGEPFRIAMVAPSASNDLAFTQSMVDAINAIGADREIEFDVTDSTFVVEDAAAALRGYAEDGYDLVIAHGSQYGGPLAEIAPDFPEVAFAWGTSADTFDLPNVSAYTVRADEGGYVMGTIAAQISGAGNIGVVGPVEVGDAKLYVDGFSAGVAAQDAAVDVNVNYIESFSDVAHVLCPNGTRRAWRRYRSHRTQDQRLPPRRSLEPAHERP
ncbi:MAG: BMP family ABC transporter substrate-binding protein [Acidimicrobiales bacterium]